MKIKLTKEIEKHLEKNQLSNDVFIESAKCYIKAIEQGRMICNIESVSKSGMSRTMKFLSCEKYASGYSYRSYYLLFKALEFNNVKGTHYFRINGCGMDMVFATNYTIIRQLCSMGFISKDKCKVLEQKTPTTI